MGSSRNRVASSPNSRLDRETLIGMMQINSSRYTVMDASGRYLIPFDMRQRYQDENHVLRMINHKIRDLESMDRVAVLRTLIDEQLPHMLQHASSEYNLQRKAIKMLAEWLPAAIHHPDDKAQLLASLIRQLNSSGISTERKTGAGLLGSSGLPNSDLAAKLIRNELKAVRDKTRKCTPETLDHLAESFNHASQGFGRRQPSLHTEQWKKTFCNPQLDPWNWRR